MVDYLKWKNWDTNSFGQLENSEKEYFKFHIDRSIKGMKMPVAILELGFGNGNFMAWAKSEGHQIIGYEINESLVEKAVISGYNAFRNLKDAAAFGPFDLIVGFDVIEHLTIDEIIEMLESLKQVLAPRGAFIFRFPNGDSPFSRNISMVI